MKFLSIAALLVFCSSTQAIMFSTIATVSLTLISLNKPVECFFGIFRRRKSPPIQETVAPPSDFFPNPMSGGMYNQFGGFGPGGGMFVPGLNNPQFGMYGNRFPPQFKPSDMPAQKPPAMPPMQQGMPQGMPPMQQGMPQGMPPMHQGMPQGMSNNMQQFPPMDMPSDMDEYGDSQGDEAPGMNTEEAESFFTLLSETDESKCISRLVCEMGANPASGGEFGQSIVEIIGSLKDFPDGSKVSEYNEVLNIGMAEGLSSCLSKFSVCDDESFELVKKAQLEDDGQSK